jgi:hypothetical protein
MQGRWVAARREPELGVVCDKEGEAVLRVGADEDAAARL